MATQEQIDKVRLYINDDDSERDFTNQQISDLIDENNSLNYATYRLCDILIARLRKELLEQTRTAEETETLASLKDRIELLKYIRDDYKELYKDENDNTTGRYIASIKPTVAGGDI